MYIVINNNRFIYKYVLNIYKQDGGYGKISTDGWAIVVGAAYGAA